MSKKKTKKKQPVISAYCKEYLLQVIAAPLTIGGALVELPCKLLGFLHQFLPGAPHLDEPCSNTPGLSGGHKPEQCLEVLLHAE